jgi:hypothetical protein
MLHSRPLPRQHQSSMPHRKFIPGVREDSITRWFCHKLFELDRRCVEQAHVHEMQILSWRIRTRNITKTQASELAIKKSGNDRGIRLKISKCFQEVAADRSIANPVIGQL